MKIIPAKAEFAEHKIEHCIFFLPLEVRPKIEDLCSYARANKCMTTDQNRILIQVGDEPQELYDAAALFEFCKNNHLKEM